MSEQPLVSIIIPCYNGEKVVGRALQAVADQTYSSIELVFINDGSTDGTEAVFKTYEPLLTSRLKKVKYFFQENRGLGGAINTGLLQITGEYFCWPDADDYLEPTSVEERVKILEENTDYAVVTSNAYIIQCSNLEEKKIAYKNTPENADPYQFLYHLDAKSIFCSGCHMVRTSMFRTVYPEMQIFPSRRGQNWQILLPLYYKYKRFFYDVPLYNYIIYPNSMSRDNGSLQDRLKRFNEHKEILEAVLAHIEKNEGVNLSQFTKFLDDKYHKLKMELYIKFGKKEDFKREYIEKQWDVGIDYDDCVAQFRMKSKLFRKFYHYWFRLFHSYYPESIPENLDNRLRLSTRSYSSHSPFYIWPNGNKKRIKKETVQTKISFHKTVSVIIPCYNSHAYIENCLKCLLSQRYKQLEIIFVNDGSTDDTEEIIFQFIPSLKRQGMEVQYIKQENQGAAKAVDAALQFVTGEYLMLYDSDDILFRDAIYDKLVYLEKHKECNMVVNNGYYVNDPFELGKNFFYYKKPNVELFFDGLLSGKYNNWTGSYMIRTEVYRNVMPEDGHIYVSRFGQNLQFMLPMAYVGQVGYIQKPLMSYYVRPDSHSHFGGIERRIEQLYGYANNRTEIIKSMKIDEKKKSYYIGEIEKRRDKNLQQIAHNTTYRQFLRFFSRAYGKIRRTILGTLLRRKLSMRFPDYS